MPRIARIVVPHLPHHITQRGNNRQVVFFSDEDRQTYLALLKKYAVKYGLELTGYCLMPNHVHIVAKPEQEDSLARTFGQVNFRYTQYLHRRRERSGHLWQNRFFSCPLDDAHAFTALLYIERNPVRAKLVKRAANYPWSSAAAHCGGKDPSDLLDLAAWRKAYSAKEWAALLHGGGTPETLEPLRMNTRTGRPLGSLAFLTKLETSLGRRLRALPVGRPKKRKTRK
jgi:putative transposase